MKPGGDALRAEFSAQEIAIFFDLLGRLMGFLRRTIDTIPEREHTE